MKISILNISLHKYYSSFTFNNTTGLRNSKNRQEQKRRFECEFCFMSLYQTKVSKPDILILAGNYGVQMECWYVPRTQSKCPKIVRRAKESARNFAIRHGESLSQYSNTQSCDSTNDFQERQVRFTITLA